MSVLVWLAGSRTGRWFASVALAFGAITFMLLKAFLAGEARIKAQQTQASLENTRTRIKKDDEISKLSADERRKRLAGWLSNDG